MQGFKEWIRVTVQASDVSPRLLARIAGLLLGVLLVIAGLCYLTDSFVYLVLPAVKFPFDIVVFSYIVEAALCLWLIVMGVNDEKWKQQAGAAFAGSAGG